MLFLSASKFIGLFSCTDRNSLSLSSSSLAVPEGTKVINTINELQASVKWEVVAYTQDWHPEDHVSFYSNHKDNPNAVLFQPLAVEDGSMQIMWPDHCIEESKGAAFHSNLVVDEEEGFFVRKGTDKNVENYSGFGPKNASGSTSQLTEKLRQEGITDVYVAGLAYDYCVGSTALDAAKEGFHTYVVIDGTRSVSPSTEEVMKERLRQAGVLSIHSSSIIEQRPNRKADVTEYLAKHKVNELFEVGLLRRDFCGFSICTSSSFVLIATVPHTLFLLSHTFPSLCSVEPLHSPRSRET